MCRDSIFSIRSIDIVFLFANESSKTFELFLCFCSHEVQFVQRYFIDILLVFVFKMFAGCESEFFTYLQKVFVLCLNLVHSG